MSAREQAAIIATALRATLVQLPASVQSALADSGITVEALAAAAANNAATVLSLAGEEG